MYDYKALARRKSRGIGGYQQMFPDYKVGDKVILRRWNRDYVGVVKEVTRAHLSVDFDDARVPELGNHLLNFVLNPNGYLEWPMLSVMDEIRKAA